jgi:hypothetical protein
MRPNLPPMGREVKLLGFSETSRMEVTPHGRNTAILLELEKDFGFRHSGLLSSSIEKQNRIRKGKGNMLTNDEGRMDIIVMVRYPWRWWFKVRALRLTPFDIKLNSCAWPKNLRVSS